MTSRMLGRSQTFIGKSGENSGGGLANAECLKLACVRDRKKAGTGRVPWTSWCCWAGNHLYNRSILRGSRNHHDGLC